MKREATEPPIVRFSEVMAIQLATLEIRVSNGSEVSGGSSVILDKKGHLATCAHVVENVERGQIFINGGPVSRFRVVGRGNKNTHDIAILRSEPNIYSDLRKIKGFKLPRFETERKNIRNGELVGICGYPAVTQGTNFPALSLGIVSIVRYPKGPIMVGALSYPGNSGGPCFTQDGVVIGLVSAGHPAARLEVYGEGAVSFPASYSEIYPGSTIQYIAKKNKVNLLWKTGHNYKA